MEKSIRDDRNPTLIARIGIQVCERVTYLDLQCVCDLDLIVITVCFDFRFVITLKKELII